MKLRRTIAIVLMTLANVIILAHGAIPHHHHEGIVFFIPKNTCCFTHLCNDSQNCCADLVEDVDIDVEAEAEISHQPHHDSCDLREAMERDGRSIFDDFQALFQFDSHYFTNTCLCILYYISIQLTVELDKATFSKYKQYSNYTENYTSPYVGSVFGLRAPPALSLI